MREILPIWHKYIPLVKAIMHYINQIWGPKRAVVLEMGIALSRALVAHLIIFLLIQS